MDEQKLTYEQFKAGILQWKNAHREEYSRFARLMTNGDEKQYLAICQAIFRKLPGIKREWELSWNDDSTEEFENIDLQFKENAVPKQIVKLYRKQRDKDNPLPDVAPPTTLWGRIKFFFSGKPKELNVILSAPSCVELALLRQELQGDGGHGQQAGTESEGRQHGQAELFLCRQTDYQCVYKERLPNPSGLGQVLCHEQCH